MAIVHCLDYYFSKESQQKSHENDSQIGVIHSQTRHCLMRIQSSHEMVHLALSSSAIEENEKILSGGLRLIIRYYCILSH